MTAPADRLRTQLRQRAGLDFARRVDSHHRLYPQLRAEWEQVADTGSADPNAFAQMFEWRFDDRPWGIVVADGQIVSADVGNDPGRAVAPDTPGVIPREVFDEAVLNDRIRLLIPFGRTEQKTAVFIPFAEEAAGVVDPELGELLIDALRERGGERLFRGLLDDQLRHEFDRFRVAIGAGFIAGQAARENLVARLANAPREDGGRILDALLQLRDEELLAALAPLANWASTDAAGMQILRSSLIELAKAAPSDILGAVPIPARHLTAQPERSGPNR